MLRTCIFAFIKSHIVFVISAIVACATMFIVPPDADYLSYIDFDTIACLFCVIAVANAFRLMGAFDRIAKLAIKHMQTPRAICCAIVFITAVLSMFATNDMALLVMLPLSATVLAKAGWASAIPATFILQSLAANLCGMILPFGNPQNLYLYSYYSLHLLEFLQVMTPVFLLSCLIVSALSWGIFSSAAKKIIGENSTHNEEMNDTDKVQAVNKSRENITSPMTSIDPDSLMLPLGKRRMTLYLALAIIALLAVFRVVPSWIAFIVIVCALVVADRRAIKEVDYYLLATFVFFFVFAGNMSRLPLVNEALGGIMQVKPLLVSALTSQIISNVPAAVLLSHFTADWQSILIGVNIGGAGTLVGSLASLITFQYYQSARKIFPAQMRGEEFSTTRFVGLFCAVNFFALAVLLIVFN